MSIKRNTIDSFSTFLQFNPQGSFQKWLSDPRLQRSISLCLAKETEPSKSTQFWSLYWHQIWQKQPKGIAREHLFAYLQESCYFSANKFWHQWRTQFPQDTIADYVQIMQTKIEKVLKSFSPQRSSIDISIYAIRIFQRAITDEKRKSVKYFGHSNWSLLKRTSEKTIRKALLGSGLVEPTVSYYVLAWKVYKELTFSSTERENKQLTEPSPEIWQQITEQYNQKRPSEYPYCSVSKIQEWIETCASKIRQWLEPPITQSLNLQLSQDAQTELQDLVSDPNAIPLLENLIDEELLSFLKRSIEQTQQTESQETFECARLYYVEALNQASIAEKLYGGSNLQYRVSRRLNSFRKSVLKFFLEILREHQMLDANLDSEKINEIGKLLEHYLENSEILFN